MNSKIIKYIVPLLLSLVITMACYAQDISIEASVNKNEIALDEEIILTIVINGSITNIPEPELSNMASFGYYSGGRSQNISIINGKISSSVSFNYVLVPNDEGSFQIGPFTIDYKGNSYSTNSIEVRVKPRNAKAPVISPPTYTYPEKGQDEQYVQENKGRELFITASVDKKNAYVNEQITLTFSFYQSVNLFENPRYSPPDTTGFWAEDMPPQKKYYTVVNGTRYLVNEIKTALFATSPGEFIIGSATLEATVEDLERFFSRSPFGRDPFSMFRRGKPILLKTDPITVNISSLPDKAKPSGFKGDVGTYNMTGEVDKGETKENEPVILKIKIEGKGNIKTISSPNIPDLEDAKVYDSGASENISKDGYIVHGEKMFEKVIVPKKAGDFKIGPIEYHYFDPSKEMYIKEEVAPIIIKVEKGLKTEPSTPILPSMIPGLTKEEIKILEKDIAYIKTHPSKFVSKDSFLYKDKMFIFINILAFLILVAFYISYLHEERLRSDIGYARSRTAKRIASKRLKKAKNALDKQDIKVFYGEIYKAVIEYIASKLNIPHPSITKELLEERLKEKDISGELIEDIKRLFDECDMARFALGRFTGDDMSKTIDDAVKVISEIERKRL
ncbi:MAG: BatD family protein [Candidatus Omnitrophota bacterium]